jgi:hypothetical protein
MSRDLHVDLAAALDDATVRPILLFEGEFASGWLYFWTGIGDLSYGGNTYTGVGTLIGLDRIQETSEIKAAGVSVSLQGIDSTMISVALSELRQNRTGAIRFALLDASEAISGDAFTVFEGRLDIGEIQERPDGAVISLRYENHLIDLERARERRYTHEDQQIDYPGDRGFEYVPALQDVVINWGNPNAAPSSSGKLFGG